MSSITDTLLCTILGESTDCTKVIHRMYCTQHNSSNTQIFTNKTPPESSFHLSWHPDAILAVVCQPYNIHIPDDNCGTQQNYCYVISWPFLHQTECHDRHVKNKINMITMALLIANCGMRLCDEAVHLAIALRFGHSLCISHTCQCGMDGGSGRPRWPRNGM